jgi:5-methylcytosine-specific restriction protein A
MPMRPKQYKPKGQVSYDQARRANGPRPYDKQAWRKKSKQARQEQPLCADCLAQGFVTPAQEVHHIDKVSENADALMTSETLSLCRTCHAIRTRRGE